MIKSLSVINWRQNKLISALPIICSLMLLVYFFLPTSLPLTFDGIPLNKRYEAVTFYVLAVGFVIFFMVHYLRKLGIIPKLSENIMHKKWKNAILSVITFVCLMLVVLKLIYPINHRYYHDLCLVTWPTIVEDKCVYSPEGSRLLKDNEGNFFSRYENEIDFDSNKQWRIGVFNTTPFINFVFYPNLRRVELVTDYRANNNIPFIARVHLADLLKTRFNNDINLKIQYTGVLSIVDLSIEKIINDRMAMESIASLLAIRSDSGENSSEKKSVVPNEQVDGVLTLPKDGVIKTFAYATEAKEIFFNIPAKKFRNLIIRYQNFICPYIASRMGIAECYYDLQMETQRSDQSILNLQYLAKDGQYHLFSYREVLKNGEVWGGYWFYKLVRLLEKVLVLFLLSLMMFNLAAVASGIKEIFKYWVTLFSIRSDPMFKINTDFLILKINMNFIMDVLPKLVVYILIYLYFYTSKGLENVFGVAWNNRTFFFLLSIPILLSGLIIYFKEFSGFFKKITLAMGYNIYLLLFSIPLCYLLFNIYSVMPIKDQVSLLVSGDDNMTYLTQARQILFEDKYFEVVLSEFYKPVFVFLRPLAEIIFGDGNRYFSLFSMLMMSTLNILLVTLIPFLVDYKRRISNRILDHSLNGILFFALLFASDNFMYYLSGYSAVWTSMLFSEGPAWFFGILAITTTLPLTTKHVNTKYALFVIGILCVLFILSRFNFASHYLIFPFIFYWVLEKNDFKNGIINFFIIPAIFAIGGVLFLGTHLQIMSDLWSRTYTMFTNDFSVPLISLFTFKTNAPLIADERQRGIIIFVFLLAVAYLFLIVKKEDFKEKKRFVLWVIACFIGSVWLQVLFLNHAYFHRCISMSYKYLIVFIVIIAIRVVQYINRSTIENRH
ncbi:MAG: hypothetical protein HQK53_12155 [Oligoflexia bacterium]|nr:hypothetical protein [Oligoflexia bacterium]